MNGCILKDMWLKFFGNSLTSVVHGAVACWQKKHYLSEFLAKGHLLRLSSQSRMSANDRDENEMTPGAVHRSPD